MTGFHSLNPTDPASIDAHPYRRRFEREWDLAAEYDLEPNLYLLEALAYHERAETLQRRNLGELPPETVSGCPLQDNVHIYDTVSRWFAGFSNVSQELMLGYENPKHDWNCEHGFNFAHTVHRFDDVAKCYLLLVHRLCGSGASFAILGDAKLPPHGWYNTPIPIACELVVDGDQLPRFFKEYEKPMFSSIGNQVPPFNKPTGSYLTGGRQYIVEYAPQLVRDTWAWLHDHPGQELQDAVEWVLKWQRDNGFKQYKFVLTAWIMDIAEYCPWLVKEDSDCYHGKNAMEAMHLVFKPRERMPRQLFYDRATRFYSDVYEKRPMDIEDSVGCDIIRWIENFIIGRGYDHLDRESIWNISYIRHDQGRQP